LLIRSDDFFEQFLTALIPKLKPAIAAWVSGAIELKSLKTAGD
jgi:hypothetical protein